MDYTISIFKCMFIVCVLRIPNSLEESFNITNCTFM